MNGETTAHQRSCSRSKKRSVRSWQRFVNKLLKSWKHSLPQSESDVRRPKLLCRNNTLTSSGGALRKRPAKMRASLFFVPFFEWACSAPWVTKPLLPIARASMARPTEQRSYAGLGGLTTKANWQ